MPEYQNQPLCDYCSEGVSVQMCHTEVHEGVEYRGHSFCLAWLKNGYGAHDGLTARVNANLRREFGV